MIGSEKKAYLITAVRRSLYQVAGYDEYDEMFPLNMNKTEHVQSSQT